MSVNIGSSENGYTYQLYNSTLSASSGASVTGNGGTISLTSAVLSSSATLSVIATNGNCSATQSQTVSVTVTPIGTANAGTDQQVCGSNATLTASSFTGGAGIWTLQTGQGTITTPNALSTSVTGLGRGKNVFVWTITNGGCINRDTVVINSDCKIAGASYVSYSSSNVFHTGDVIATLTDPDGLSSKYPLMPIRLCLQALLCKSAMAQASCM